MKTVILCNRLDRLKGVLKRTPGPLRYLNLTEPLSLVETQESRRICEFLRQEPGSRELSKSRLFRKRGQEFRQMYVRFMGRLNAENRCLDWWAMSFTNKYPLTTNLCRDTSAFLLITELLQRDDSPLLVITDSLSLSAQVKRWADGEGINAVDLVRPSLTYRRLLRQYTPAGITKVFLDILWFWVLSRRYRPVENLTDSHLVITTLTHPRCFSSGDGYRDAYFGPVVEHLADSEQKGIVLALPLEQPAEQIKGLKRIKSGVPIVPLESCLTLGNILACAWRALRLLVKPVQPQGPLEINGIDLSYLVVQAIKEAQRSGDILWNLRVYYGARWLARRIRVNRCLYPYENRAWEKMVLLGVRSVSPRSQMVGYQHTSVTPSHTNLLFGEEEAEITPLPDMILTTGEVVEQRLAEEGHYPPGIFKTACALRQDQPSPDGASRRRQPLTRILVALATSSEEYLKTVDFLEEAFTAADDYDVRIRPHPNLEQSSSRGGRFFLPPRDFYSLSTEPLADEIRWADVVLYASSTVGLEAISLGIPAMYMDLGNFLDTDPMFGWDVFKWSVQEPSELVDTLHQIEALPEDAFLERQQEGREYAAAYLKPVTEEAMAAFWGPVS